MGSKIMNASRSAILVAVIASLASVASKAEPPVARGMAITGSGHMLFPGERGGRHMALDTIRRALEHMGYKGRMTGHGFRGIASTLLHEHEFDHQHIERKRPLSPC